MLIGEYLTRLARLAKLRDPDFVSSQSILAGGRAVYFQVHGYADQRDETFKAQAACFFATRFHQGGTAHRKEGITRGLSKLAQPGEPFYGIHASNDGKVMIFAGGVPLKRGDQIIGASGVSGGTGTQDQSVAGAGAEAF